MQVDIKGLDEALQKLATLNVEEKLINKALNKAGELTKEAIKKEAPVDSGLLRDEIKAKRAKNGEVVVHSGGGYHAHLVEFGRSGGSVITKKGRLVKWGPTTPNPFFTRGFKVSESKAKEAMVEELQKGLKL